MNLDAVVLLLLFGLGLVVGGQVNRGIYRLAWEQRSIGPWSPRDPRAPGRQWFDRLPVLGWWFLRREEEVHGEWYWLRPLLIELAMGLGFAAIYWYEVLHNGVAAPYRYRPPIETLQLQCLAHLLLISLMMVATFIDFDEQTIPDAIVVPGALLGLFLAAVFPDSRPLVKIPTLLGPDVRPLHLASGTALPGQPDWPSWLDGTDGLLIGLSAFLAWWLAILPWTWTTRRGLPRAVMYFVASLRRRTTWLMGSLVVCGLPMVIVTWAVASGERWESLLSALVGMAFGGAMVWAFRVAATRALGQEAIGFGDVTLMAMIGTFTGWQATLMIFFMAPGVGVVVSVVRWLTTGRRDIAFGPYLCMATLLLVLRWGWFWQSYAASLFSLGWLIPAMIVGCIALTWALLTMMRALREWREGVRE